MRDFVTQRLLTFIPTLFGVSVIIFLVIRSIPGDTISAQFGTQTILTPQQRAALLEYYGLDKPVTEQYVRWVGGIFQGNLGVSVRSGKPVLGEILNRYPLTLELTLLAMVIALLIGIPIGVISARYRGTAIDGAGQFFALLGLALPNFWVGTLLILALSQWFGILLNSGDYIDLAKNPSANLRQMIFPALTLGLGFTAAIARTTRSAMLEELRKDYARTARSKGLREQGVMIKHCLSNALIPIITIAGIQMGYLLGGAILVEQVFALPGLGQLLINAIGQRDYAVVQGVVLFIALNFLLINLLADMLYAVVNPRVRAG